jgi:hypothetical protein
VAVTIGKDSFRILFPRLPYFFLIHSLLLYLVPPDYQIGEIGDITMPVLMLKLELYS